MKYTKDFDNWSRLKKVIQDTSIAPGYKEREVWWAKLGANIGDEEDGKGAHFSRPVLIVKGFSRNLVWVVALTSVNKRGRYYYPIILNNQTNVVILSQLKSLDARRFTNRIGVLDDQSFEVVRRKLRGLIS